MHRAAVKSTKSSALPSVVRITNGQDEVDPEADVANVASREAHQTSACRSSTTLASDGAPLHKGDGRSSVPRGHVVQAAAEGAMECPRG